MESNTDRTKAAADEIRYAKICKMIEKEMPLSSDDVWFYNSIALKKGDLMEVDSNMPLYEGVDAKNHKCSKCRFFFGDRCYNIESLSGEERGTAELVMRMNIFNINRVVPECDVYPDNFCGYRLRYNSIGLSCFSKK